MFSMFVLVIIVCLKRAGLKICMINWNKIQQNKIKENERNNMDKKKKHIVFESK